MLTAYCLLLTTYCLLLTADYRVANRRGGLSRRCSKYWRVRAAVSRDSIPISQNHTNLSRRQDGFKQVRFQSAQVRFQTGIKQRRLRGQVRCAGLWPRGFEPMSRLTSDIMSMVSMVFSPLADLTTRKVRSMRVTRTIRRIRSKVGFVSLEPIVMTCIKREVVGCALFGRWAVPCLGEWRSINREVVGVAHA